jgi:hypothetical protein
MEQIRDIFNDHGLSVEQYADRYRRDFLRRMGRKYRARRRKELRNKRQLYLELE